MAAGPDDDLVERIAAAVAAKLGVAAAAGQKPVLGELLDAWKAAHLKLASFGCDYRRAQRLFAWAPAEGQFAGIRLADRDPMSLTATDVDLWRSSRYSQITRLKKEPSAATINREVMMLVRVLNFAAGRRKISRNPLLGDDIFEEEDNAREVVIDEGGFLEILHLVGPNHIAAAYVTFAFDSAMRMTEVLLCRWSWLDRVRGFVTIPGAVAKNGKQRVADLTDRMLLAADRLPRSLASDHIFVNPATAKLYDRRWLYELYRRAVEESTVRGPSGEMPIYHDLRRAWITLARRRGIPESEIMAKSGHADHSVFRRYSIVGDEDLRRSRERMEAGRQADIALVGDRRGPRRAPVDKSPDGKIKSNDRFFR